MLFYLDVAFGYGLVLKSFVTANSTPAEVFAAEAQYCLDHGVPKGLVLACGFSNPRAMAEELYPDEETFQEYSLEDQDGLYQAFVLARDMARASEELSKTVGTQTVKEERECVAVKEVVSPLEVVAEGLRAVGCTELYVGVADKVTTVKVQGGASLLDSEGKTVLREREIGALADLVQMVPMHTEWRDFDIVFPEATRVLCTEYGEIAEKLSRSIPFEEWFGQKAGYVLQQCCIASQQFALLGLLEQYKVLLKPGEMCAEGFPFSREVLGVGVLHMLDSVPAKCERRAEDACWQALRVVAWHLVSRLFAALVWRLRLHWDTGTAFSVMDFYPRCTGRCPFQGTSRFPSESLSVNYKRWLARLQAEHED